jgi:uncharacterized MAPEG superfamily protein
MILSIELKMLLWASLLGIIQLMLATHFKTIQSGIAYNVSARDKEMEYTGVAGRLDRAFKNFLETFPFFIVGVVIIQLTALGNTLSMIGVHMYFWSRLVYVPLYASGVPYLRSLAWTLSLIGIVLLFLALI